MKTNADNIPAELKLLPQWVCVSGTNKIPKNPYNGKTAKANNPSTWGTFAQAVKACEVFGFEYIGFEFAPPYFGVDLDHCLDNVEFCDEFVEGLKSYNEYSKSGSGLHIICRGELPDGARRRGNVEMYSEGRYFICTGNIYNGAYTAIRDCTESIKPLHGKYLGANETRCREAVRACMPLGLSDAEILERASNCKTGLKFRLLYSGNWELLGYRSRSEADLALCGLLAFWCDENAATVDRLFRQSGLMRDKWDEVHGAQTYGQMTIAKALERG